MLKISVTDRPREEAARALTTWLNELQDRATLLLLSGGSALSFLDLVGIPEKAQLTVSVLDERFSIDPAVNNFLQLSRTQFFARALARGLRVLPTIPLDTESCTELAARLSKQVAIWQKQHPQGAIVATMGIGSDGHTAGILSMPHAADQFTKLFVNTNELFVGYKALEGTSTFRERVTATIPFLTTAIERSLIFAVGAEKVLTLQRLYAGEGTLHEFPMLCIRNMQNPHVVTDIDKE